jgi:hypothetical protein
MIGSDGLHHTDRGYACIAASLGRSINEAVAKPFVTVSTGHQTARGTTPNR